jgi:hypothetical protein
VRYDSIRSCGIDGDGKGEGKNEAGNNCQPDKIHTSLLGLDSVIRLSRSQFPGIPKFVFREERILLMKS